MRGDSMSPQKLKRSATWWQMVRNGKLLGGTDKPTKRECIECYCALVGFCSAEDTNVVWANFKARGDECVKVTAFWEVSK